ncbi:MAG: FkbM family methyltransferase [Candidatus Giovannonibacteria bacterium]|nr:FkbM family methyltransferase [Candidatus Giovannonibacteria bacterium]
MIKKILKKLNTLRNLDWNWAWRYYKKHLVKYASYYFSKISGREFWDVNVDGVNLKMSFSHPYHHLFAHNIHKGTHETNLLIMWKKKCEEADGVILDLGAYSGIFGLLAAKANSKSEVFMIEPDSINVRHIKNNIVLNNLTNAHAIKAVVSDKIGAVSFKEAEGATSGNIIQGGSGELEVLSITLDDWAEKNKKIPTLIKCDVEGAELRTLIGAKKILSESKNLNILLEVHYNFLKRFGDTEEELWSFLKSLGYNAIWLDQDQFNRHYWVWRELT